jgi:hypothetical protein
MENCAHTNKIIPADMEKPTQKLMHVIGLVECRDCGMVIGNCRWVRTQHSNIAMLKFDPESLDTYVPTLKGIRAEEERV